MNPIRPPRDKHPSGRSLRREQRRGWPDGYANREGLKTVRLRDPESKVEAKSKVEAIGFRTPMLGQDDED